MSGISSRKSPRRALKKKMGILMQGQFQIVDIHQLGEGGCLFSVPSTASQEIFEGPVTVTLQVPGGGMFCTRADILYDRKIKHRDLKERTAYGCTFKDLPLHARRWVRNFVAAKTEKEVEDDLFH
jgi:hypothetical protein